MGDLLVDCPLVVTPVGLEFEMNFQLGRVLQNQELGVGGWPCSLRERHRVLSRDC